MMKPTGTNKKGYITKSVFELIERKIQDPSKHLECIADLIRFNTLVSVARAGSGHLGSSLSMIEILTEIYFRSFKFDAHSLKDPNRDIFVLSKGHAVPSLYATLAARGYFPVETLDSLRRRGGLQGHGDIITPGIESNTGSLAMGLSKAVGYAMAKKRLNLRGNVVVVVGDGELQEGQCWEAFLSAASYKLDNLYIIIDDNKVQTDTLTQKIVFYSHLTASLKELGFNISECQGSKIKSIHQALMRLKQKKGKPKILWSHTIKGQGVSFMEHPNVLKDAGSKYVWHNKPPNKEQLTIALNEILKRNMQVLSQLNLDIDISNSLLDIPKEPIQKGIEGDNLVSGFSEGLLEIARNNPKVVVIDGDLEEDCGFVPFHKAFPRRFFEFGIMEQHMISAATAFSRLGYIPVIASYAAFLTSRANEQIYNLSTEGGKAVIVGNMSGVIPATPGKSHQGFRDIACIKNIPNVLMYQPITEQDARNSLIRYIHGDFGNLFYLRLSLAASRKILPDPPSNLKKGYSHVVKKGKHALVIGIGPVVLGECLSASEILKNQGIDIEIWNHPWLIDFNYEQLLNASKRKIPLVIIEDHYKKGGFGESLLSFISFYSISFPYIIHIALNQIPQTGFREEILSFLGLGDRNISTVISKTLSS